MKKTIVIGVTGGIAAFKACQLVSDLVKLDFDVHVIMSKHALEFVGPLTFETLSNHKVHIDMFDRNFQHDVTHISLAKKADVFCIVPATANTIGKLACGIADDMLTTTFMATTAKKIICPAMNTNMYANPIVQENIEKLKQHGVCIVEPESGLLACKDVGVGKLASIEEIKETILDCLTEKTLEGYRVLITAGATLESIDPIRYITNHSSGKMGYSLARMAKRMGADVTLVAGNVTLPRIPNVTTIFVKSALDMFEAVKKHYKDQDMIIKAAAVSDYTVKTYQPHKMKKSDDDLTLALKRTDDILSYLGKHKDKKTILCGFAMESEHLIDYAQKKLVSKHCDLIVANNVTEANAGFQHDTNIATIVTKDQVESLGLMSKLDLAKYILLKMKEMG